jgi:capsular polysaccharide biosynthesis protein
MTQTPKPNSLSNPQQAYAALLEKMKTLLNKKLIGTDLEHKLRLMPLGFYSEGSRAVASLTPEEKCLLTGPVEPATEPGGLTSTFPPIKARSFQNVEAVECSSALIRGNVAYIPDYCQEHQANSLHEFVFLAHHSSSRRLALMLDDVRPRAWNGIMLFQLGANNWYHWLIEILPMAFLAERLPSEYSIYPFIVPKKIAQFSSFRESLELFLNGRKTVEIDELGFRFNELIVIDPISHGPFNLADGIWPAKEMFRYHPGLLLEYRNAILERLGIQQKTQSDLIFLARGNDRREFNEDEIHDIAIQHGFRLVHMETLSFREQVEVMFGAKVIIGASGAAFSNILFCQKGARVLSWLPPQFKGFLSFTNLADAVGADMRYVFSQPLQPIADTHDAYRAKYHLDLNVFENALKLALHAEKY